MATLHISNGGYGRSLYGSWDAKAANREGRKPLTASAAPRMFLVLNAAVAQNDPGQPSPSSLDIPPRRCLPPVEFCRGTRPSPAANSRPLRKPLGSTTVAAMRADARNARQALADGI